MAYHKNTLGTPTKQTAYSEQRMTRLSSSGTKGKGKMTTLNNMTTTTTTTTTTPKKYKITGGANLTIQTSPANETTQSVSKKYSPSNSGARTTPTKLYASTIKKSATLTPSGKKSLSTSQTLKKKLYMKKRTPPTPKTNLMTPSSASKFTGGGGGTTNSTLFSTTTTTTTTKKKIGGGRTKITGTKYSWNRNEAIYGHLFKTFEPKDNLLVPQSKRSKGKKTLVLDLDETLIHSSFVPIQQPDYIIPFSTSDGQKGIAYVKKRPGVDQFMKRVGELFECVIFTASLKLYAKPLLDIFDRYNVIEHRLYRHHCSFDGFTYKKDLTKLGRDVSQTLLLDNSPISYELQPQNGMPCASWYDSKTDYSLIKDVLPWLEKIAEAKDVYEPLREYKRKVKIIEPEPH